MHVRRHMQGVSQQKYEEERIGEDGDRTAEYRWACWDTSDYDIATGRCIVLDLK